MIVFQLSLKYVHLFFLIFLIPTPIESNLILIIRHANIKQGDKNIVFKVVESVGFLFYPDFAMCILKDSIELVITEIFLAAVSHQKGLL